MTYTRDELYAMPAGRDLDAAVATTLFGWRWMQYQVPNRNQLWLLTALFPPDAPRRICVANDYDQIWSPSDRHQPRFSGWDRCVWWQDSEAQYGMPDYSTCMDDAWLVVAYLRDLWTAATDNVGNNDDFPRPFADMEFFEHLHRHADRRWPWAMLYMTPDAICRAALLSVIEEDAQP